MPQLFFSRFWVMILLATCLIPLSSPAQSDTGRRRATGTPAESHPENSEAGAFSGLSQWRFAFQAGLTGAGRAFQVENPSGLAVPWDLGNGSAFQASRFNATFDQNPGFGIEVTRDMGTYWCLNGAVNYARLDLGAEALAGQKGVTVLLDRVDLFQFGLGVTGKLVARPSHPFVTAEALYSNLEPARLTELAQSSLGWRVGFGYRHVLSPRWAGRAQIRLSRMSFSTDDFTPEVTVLDPPDIEVTSEDHLTFFEIMLGVEFH